MNNFFFIKLNILESRMVNSIIIKNFVTDLREQDSIQLARG